MEVPSHQLEFEKMFSDESQCEELIINLKWENGFICPRCNNTTYWKQTRRRLCCQKCRAKISILKGTLFEQSNKPLVLWFRVIWAMVILKNGISALGLQKLMGFGSYKTAFTWLHRLRELTILPDRTKLSGKVEVDESFLGGKHEGKRGRGAEGKILIAIAVEVLEYGTGRIRLAIIKDASTKSLRSFIEANIEKNAEIITDGWKSYKNIKGYKHTVTDKSILMDSESLLPNVHRVASLLKRWQLGTHQSYITSNKAQNYLEEFTFRYNRRTAKTRGLLFHKLIKQAVDFESTSKKSLTNKGV